MNKNDEKLLKACKLLGIQTMPIVVDIKAPSNPQDPKNILEDGSIKMKKDIMCGGKYTWFYEPGGKEKIASRQKEFDRDGYITCWDKQTQRNVRRKSNMFAWDTSKEFKCLDIDCILKEIVDGKTNPFIELLTKLPYKKSNTKSFGKHILAKIPGCENLKAKEVFDAKYGEVKGKGGIDFLNKQWAWSKNNAVLHNFYDWFNSKIHDLKNYTEFDIVKELTKIIKKEIKKELKKEIKKDIKPLMMEHIKQNILDYFKKNDIADVGKSASLILGCASSGSEEVYQIVHNIMKSDASYSDESWVRNNWDAYRAGKHSGYKSRFDEKINIKNYKVKLPEIGLEMTQAGVAEELVKLLKDDFIRIPHDKAGKGFYHFNEKKRLWNECGGNGMMIVKILSYIKKCKILFEKNIHTKYKEEDWEEAKKEIKKLFRTNSSQEGIAKLTIRELYNELEPQAELAFNQEDDVAHYFQFKNGAFNFKTGKLEERTRDMYISESLKYDYEPPDEDMKEKIKIIQAEFETILPDPIALLNHKKWRSAGFLGITIESFMLNIGYTGGNGKSYGSEIFCNAFPIYGLKLGNDVFDLGNEKAMTKQIPALWGSPVRMTYLEEWGKKKIDLERFKNIVGAETAAVCPLYMGEKQMKLIMSMEASSNVDPKLGEVDNAVCRRGKCQEYNSEFRDTGVAFSDGSQELNSEIHHYKSGGPNKKKRFKNPKWALALFHWYLPQIQRLAKDEYSDLQLSQEMADKFSQNIEANCRFADFFNECISKSPGDNIHKTKLTQQVQDYFGSASIDFPTIRQEFQKKGFTYDCKKKKGTQSKRNFKKGFMLDVKFTLQNGMLDSSDDEEPEEDPYHINI